MSQPNVDTRFPIFFAFLPMPFVMGGIAHFLVPPAEGGFAVALPDGSNSLHWVFLALGLVLTVASVAVGRFGEQRAAGPDRRQSLPVPWLVRLAMAESVAILGVAATVALGIPGAWVPFSVFSLLGIVLAKPSRD